MAPCLSSSKKAWHAQVHSAPVYDSNQSTAHSVDVPQRSNSTSKKMTRKQAMLSGGLKLNTSLENLVDVSDKRTPLAMRSPNVRSPLPQEQYVKNVASPKNKSRRSSTSFNVLRINHQVIHLAHYASNRCIM